MVSLIYNVVGPRIVLAGGTDGPHTASGPSIGEMPRHTIDLTAMKKISRRISVNLGIMDLLNQPVLLMEDANQDGRFTRTGDKVIEKYRRGSYYTAGVKISL